MFKEVYVLNYNLFSSVLDVVYGIASYMYIGYV
jgi:hypothetical protein